jgi:hypothetical protein
MSSYASMGRLCWYAGDKCGIEGVGIQYECRGFLAKDGAGVAYFNPATSALFMISANASMFVFERNVLPLEGPNEPREGDGCRNVSEEGSEPHNASSDAFKYITNSSGRDEDMLGSTNSFISNSVSESGVVGIIWMGDCVEKAIFSLLV